MSRPRFFLEEILAEEETTVRLNQADCHHAARVLRLKPGEEIDLVDGARQEYVVRLDLVSPDKVSGEIIARLGRAEKKGPRLLLLQGLPRGGKTDEIIQKSVELGVDVFLPLLTLQSQIRLDEAGARKKQERWQKISAMAASQSGRPVIPAVESPLKLGPALVKLQEEAAAIEGEVLNLMAWEGEFENSLSGILTPERMSAVAEIRILVGPEGGFALEEVELCRAHGFLTVSLGPRILRTETAGPAMLAAIGFAAGIL